MKEFMHLLAWNKPTKPLMNWAWEWKVANPKGTVEQFFLAQKAKGQDGEVRGLWAGVAMSNLYWCFMYMLDYQGRKTVWNEELHCRAINALAHKCTGSAGLYGMTRNEVAEALARAYAEE
jgi:hypothetical protein